MKSTKVGLLGGTFNPLHTGHLILAQEAMEHAALERVVFMPNREPPHKNRALIDAEHRYQMLSLGIASQPRFYASRFELEREGPSYSVDTVAALREAHPDWQWYFITGADALMRYEWKDLDRLLGLLAAMLVGTRPGFSLTTLLERLDGLQLRHRQRVQTFEFAGLEVSSTDLRSRVEAGRTISYLVPRSVEAYIAKYGLYQPAKREAAFWV
jgi:nicotinate-nucleotide adenylyltransferase